MLFLSLLGRPKFVPSNSEVIPGSSAQHADLTQLPDPCDQSSMPMSKRIQVGIRRVRMEKGSKSRIRLPITLTVLGKIHQQLITTQHPHRQLLWAISALAFFGFFRLGELPPERSTFNHKSDLAWEDVAVDNHATQQWFRYTSKSGSAINLEVGLMWWLVEQARNCVQFKRLWPMFKSGVMQGAPFLREMAKGPSRSRGLSPSCR